MEILGILAALFLGRVVTRGYTEFERAVACLCLMVLAAEALAWWRFL